MDIHKIPLGEVIADFVDWLTLHGADYFDAFADTLATAINGFTHGLLWFNPLALIALFGADRPRHPAQMDAHRVLSCCPSC